MRSRHMLLMLGAAVLVPMSAAAQRYCMGSGGQRQCFDREVDCNARYQRCLSDARSAGGGNCPRCQAVGGPASAAKPGTVAPAASLPELLKQVPRGPDPKLGEQSRQAVKAAAAPVPKEMSQSRDELNRRLQAIVEAEESSEAPEAMGDAAAGGLTGVAKVWGKAEICREGSGCLPLKPGDSLRPGETVKTGKDGGCMLSLGAGAGVKVGPSTTYQLGVPGKRFPLGRLLDGSFWARVKSDLGVKKCPGFWDVFEQRCVMDFSAGTAVAAVRGTAFRVRARPGESARLLVAEGAVDWSASDEPGPRPGWVARPSSRRLAVGSYECVLDAGADAAAGGGEAAPSLTLKKGRAYLRRVAPGPAPAFSAPGSSVELGDSELLAEVEAEYGLTSYEVFAGTAAVRADSAASSAREALADWPEAH